MKRLISLVLLFLLGYGIVIPAFAQEVSPVILNNNSKYIFQGHAEIDQGEKLDPNIFTGEITTVKKGSKLKMSVSSVINTSYAEDNDEFFAQITNDVATDKGVIIPAGSFAHGILGNVTKAKKLGRDGFVDMNFDYIITSDGRKIPIEASMTTKANPIKSTAKHIAKDTGYMVGGGAMGGWLALNFLGLPSAIVSHGATVAGGAGIGAVAGLGIALSEKGKEVLITPQDEINVSMLSSMELPVMKKEAFCEEEIFCDNLNIKITSIKLEKDPFGQPDLITMGLVIDNQTKKSFSVFDMALVSDLKEVYYPSPFDNTDFWFNRINPGDRTATRLSFAVNNPKKKHWLVIYDSYSRKPMIKLSLENARREISKKADKD